MTARDLVILRWRARDAYVRSMRDKYGPDVELPMDAPWVNRAQVDEGTPRHLSPHLSRHVPRAITSFNMRGGA